MELNNEIILNALRKVAEPDLGKDIVELGLVSNIEIEGHKVRFTVRVSNPAMHSRKRMEDACIFNIQRTLGNDVEVEVDVQGIEVDAAPELRKVLPGVKNIIAVASGKGGVGKSTITANLAVGLASKGYKVGLVDADIYGPSMPLMLDVFTEKPGTTKKGEKSLIVPVENYGVKMLSIGFFADPDQAIVWRGPMASKALNQMFKDAEWGELDYMLIDLPPGTGDIHLSLVQAVPLTGAIIVSTPQGIALADAKKGVAMFQLPQINVPVLGIVENMAWFTPEELPENKYYIFGKEGARQLAEDLNVKLLGEIPLVQSIREASDVGRPAVLQSDTPSQRAFSSMIDRVIEQTEKRNSEQEPTKVVRKEMRPTT